MERRDTLIFIKKINCLNMNKKTGINVLFIYPNTYGINILSSQQSFDLNKS